MLFGDAKITVKELAQEVVDGVANVMGEESKRPPCNSRMRTSWTKAVREVLGFLAEDRNYVCYPWLLDFVWWDSASESLILAAECEWSQAKAEEDDFQKLAAFKCPLKLFVFSGDAERTKKMA